AVPSSQAIIRAKMPETNSEPKKKTRANTAFTFADEKLPVHNPRVAARLKRMLESYSYENLQTYKLHEKAAQWFPVIVPILKNYGIPEDFKYMVLVESGLRSGTSHKGASGYWQFMPGTARGFGLKVNGRVDERNHFRKSTVAAAKYLRALYDEFGSWTLAAAAYNIGDYRLRKLMDRQNEDDYFRMRLNHETATYVYRLMSMKEIIENPDRYGYESKEDPELKLHPPVTDNIQRFVPFSQFGEVFAFQTED
ncbi:MAG TPA: lytic transglycosylase domain-containing protein, partial [Sphingobacteriaceae bacterium]